MLNPVYRKNGVDAAFQAPKNYAAGPYPFWITSGDFNRDGIIDLAVVGSEQNRVAILLGNGDGSFQKPVYFGAGESTSSAAAGDFNGDGILDLAVTHNIGGATGWGGVRAGETASNIITVSVDEKPGVQAIGNTAPDLPPVPGKHPTVSRDHEYERLGTCSILAALDLQDGQVTAGVENRHRSVEFIGLLSDLDAKYPPECTISIILDLRQACRDHRQ